MSAHWQDNLKQEIYKKEKEKKEIKLNKFNNIIRWPFQDQYIALRYIKSVTL